MKELKIMEKHEIRNIGDCFDVLDRYGWDKEFSGYISHDRRYMVVCWGGDAHSVRNPVAAAKKVKDYVFTFHTHCDGTCEPSDIDKEAYKGYRTSYVLGEFIFNKYRKGQFISFAR